MIKYFEECVIKELESQIQNTDFKTDEDVFDWCEQIEVNYGEQLTLNSFIHLTDLAFDKLDNTY